jgi:hypothetical protein
MIYPLSPYILLGLTGCQVLLRPLQLCIALLARSRVECASAQYTSKLQAMSGCDPGLLCGNIVSRSVAPPLGGPSLGCWTSSAMRLPVTTSPNSNKIRVG